MPLYEYWCERDGTFEATRPITDFAAPADCPACGRAAPRILSVPRLRLTAPHDRAARDRNEKSRHEPSVVTRHGPAEDARVPPAWSSAGGMPWAVGH